MHNVFQINPFVYQNKTYRHQAKSIVATKDMMMKNSSETVIKKTYVQKNISGQGYIFDVETLSEKVGKESATAKLNADMNSLTKKMTVGTNLKGSFEKIYNKREVIDQWAKVKKKWKKEATKEEREQVEKTISIVEQNLANGSFEKEVAQQGVFYFMFPGLYGDYPKEGTVVKRQLSKFLVTQPLPLKITYRLINKGNSKSPMVLEGVGEVDEDRLDSRQLAKLIRSIKDKLDMAVELQVDYRERLEFDRSHWLNKATQNVKVKIPGFYMTESKQEIAELNTETDGR